MIENREQLVRTDRHDHALQAIQDGIGAAHPRSVVADAVHLDGSTLQVGDEEYTLDAYDDIVVLGGGNAAGHVAVSLESVLGSRLSWGLVVTDDPTETDTIEVIEGTHPLPSTENVEGTRRLLEYADSTTAEDLVIVTISGGGSALLCAPAESISLDDYREVTDQLLRSGATIDEINAVRKHLSAIKGGQLARTLAPSETVSLLLSDVVGNRLDVIASGPTAPDPSTYADALAVCDRYDLALPTPVEQHLDSGAAGEQPETPDSGSPAFDRVSNHVIGDGRTAINAAAATLADLGYEPLVLSTRIEGEAREVGTVHAGIALESAESGDPVEPPAALLSGGETTVTVTEDGRGGPNQEFALSCALGLVGGGGTGKTAEGDDIVVASIDTDGIDGNTDAAGAILDGEIVPDTERERARDALDRNAVYTYLEDHDALIETGPTGTNVNDLRVLLVGTPP